ncbi:kinase-like protein [Microthyrium microscopicum]|uniref:Kinase-like protein n=1 Tax=Microthyrium microscopicum TaxID=703497 RepID=A0A6A6USQ8_9PEZI|nr:kinase-like protein [Microthyrium microscopicum]
MSINSQYSLSPGSVIGSPALNAMTDITPLPSPIMSEETTSMWKKGHTRPGSSGSLSSLRENAQVNNFSGQIPSASTSRASSTKKKKSYNSLMPAAVEASGIQSQNKKRHDSAHSRHRSLSEYIPEPMHNVRPRNTTLSTGSNLQEVNFENPLHREKHLAEQRGFISHHGEQQPPQTSFPTPPPSNRSISESEPDEIMRDEEPNLEPSSTMTVRDQISGSKLQYREVKPLGQGTFSRVILGTKQCLPPSAVVDEEHEIQLDPKELAALKIVEHGPAGGADEERMELSLKREVEIMRSIHHPSLIHLKAYGINEQESIMVLGYCPGGDLFELASEHQDVLSPQFVQRIFAELVSAVSYLHGKNIVHRDLKLENVLVNVHRSSLRSIQEPITYPTSIVTLTDLGLSREIDPANPMLTTRCGSEDYAAPEILLSQSYDGRATDAWALGVLLYALMEGRLPFDPPPPKPGSRVRSRGRAAHRIARCEWIWSRFGDADGDWDEAAGKGWEEARDIVDGLLRKVNRGRFSLADLTDKAWVKAGIQVPGGIKRGYEDDDESS